ncbi:MAG: DUF4013 domain-containing protein [Methanoregula sp.]|jgi:hypothetical protein|uniref:DUF4013 domain-containing protein n=1 Tax=Methanoregula sp. TaxID=2052170 RepID=UPI003C1BFE17
MSFGSMLDDSFSYAKEGVWGKWKHWLLLIASMIIFPLILGYMVRIYRGEKPAPELKEWGTLFIDGLKLLAVSLIYALPIILLALAAFLPFIAAFTSSGAFSMDFTAMTEAQTEQWLTSHPEIMSAAGLMLILLLVTLIIAIIITIFSFIGSVRFARTGRIGEGFNFSEILGQIRRIGWLTYIAALIIIGVIGIVFWLLLHIFSFIPVIGGIVFLIVAIVLYPPFILFVSRYAALVYECGDPGTVPLELPPTQGTP